MHRASICFWVLLVCGCSQETTSSIELTQCDQVSVRGSFTLTWQESALSQLRFTAKEALADTLQVKQQDKLVVHLPSGGGELTVLCACPDRLELLGNVRAQDFGCQVKDLRLYGESRASLAALAQARVQLRASGQAQLEVNGVDVDHLDVQAGGAARVVLQGSADLLSVSTANKSMVQAEALRVQDAVVQARGTSTVRVWPTAHLSLDGSVNSTISYRGEPELSPPKEDR